MKRYYEPARSQIKGDLICYIGHAIRNARQSSAAPPASLHLHRCWECRGEVRPKVWLGGDVFGVYDGGRSFDGGHDGSEKQVDAGGGGNRVSDWQSRSQGASGGQGGVSGQKGAGEYFQAGGRFEAAIAEDCKAVEARAAIGDRGKVLRVPRAAGSMAKAICVGMAFSLAPERNRSPDFTSGENAVLRFLRR